MEMYSKETQESGLLCVISIVRSCKKFSCELIKIVKISLDADKHSVYILVDMKRRLLSSAIRTP